MTNENKELEIYDKYQNIICRYIMELEVLDAEYPIEVFNEVRDAFTHLSRYKLQNSVDDLYSAEKHIKRGILDCYKYLCVSYAERLHNFRYEYRKVDLHLANDGKFLQKLDMLENEAQKAYRAAKYSEITNEQSDDYQFKLFEEAYNKYADTNKHLEDSNESIIFVTNQSKRRNIITVISIIVSIISTIVAILLAIF